VARIDTRWPDHIGRGFLAVATVVLVLLGAACTSAADREHAGAAHDVAAWPLRGNLTGDRALLDDASERLDAEGREPGRLLVATRVEGLTLLVAETQADGGSFVALYGLIGTPVRAMRLVDLGKPTDASSLSMGIDNDIAAVALVVPAPNVTRVAIKASVDSQGEPVMVDVPIRDGVAALPLKGQRPANTLIDLEVGGHVVGSTPELQAMDVDDPVKAQPNFKPAEPPVPQSDLRDDAAVPPQSGPPRGLAVAFGLFVALVAVGAAAWLATNRLRRGRSVGPCSPGRRKRWSLAAIVLALVTPLVQLGSSATMATLAYSHPELDASGPVLMFAPAVAVSAAAVLCAHAGLRQVHGPTSGRAVALSATVLAYLVAGLLLAGLLSVMHMLAQGG
jgi:hypothetical protein